MKPITIGDTVIHIRKAVIGVVTSMTEAEDADRNFATVCTDNGGHERLFKVSLLWRVDAEEIK